MSLSSYGSITVEMSIVFPVVIMMMVLMILGSIRIYEWGSSWVIINHIAENEVNYMDGNSRGINLYFGDKDYEDTFRNHLTQGVCKSLKHKNFAINSIKISEYDVSFIVSNIEGSSIRWICKDILINKHRYRPVRRIRDLELVIDNVGKYTDFNQRLTDLKMNINVIKSVLEDQKDGV